jgi:hypothetical protein
VIHCSWAVAQQFPLCSAYLSVGRPASSAKERVRSKSSVRCPARPGEANISSKRKRRGGMLPRCRPSRQQLGSVAEVQSTSISEMLFCRLGGRQHGRIASGTELHHRHRLVRCFEVDGVGALDEGANAIDPASVDDCVSNLPRVLAQQSTLSRGDTQQAYERRRSLESNAAYELLKHEWLVATPQLHNRYLSLAIACRGISPGNTTNLYDGSSIPACSFMMYFAYQSGQFASVAPIRFSCSP